MSTLRAWLKRLNGRKGQSSVEYVLTISVLTIAALAATSAFGYAYVCVFNGSCADANVYDEGLPQDLADSLTSDGIQGVGNGSHIN